MSNQRWFPDDMPPPAASRETLGWWQAAAEHRLLVQRCTDCGQTRMPPGPLCPACRSFNRAWQEVSGHGTVYTYTIVHRAYVPSLADTLPYVVIVVELDGSGGVRLTSNLVDADSAVVHVGMAVEVAWEDLGPGVAVPRFRPA
ncbi:MAG TPA: Zn-ribbon domain-containing OB-fold protein [Candidatus Acidoferrales bacterium]|nr:Zn-ribbon domain-containing OB-fold protein [Candidatus Acidoferrales bacterium]